MEHAMAQNLAFLKEENWDDLKALTMEPWMAQNLVLLTASNWDY